MSIYTPNLKAFLWGYYKNKLVVFSQKEEDFFFTKRSLKVSWFISCLLSLFPPFSPVHTPSSGHTPIWPCSLSWNSHSHCHSPWWSPAVPTLVILILCFSAWPFPDTFVSHLVLLCKFVWSECCFPVHPSVSRFSSVLSYSCPAGICLLFYLFDYILVLVLVLLLLVVISSSIVLPSLEWFLVRPRFIFCSEFVHLPCFY